MLEIRFLSTSMLSESGREGAGDEEAEEEFSYASNRRFSVLARSASFS